MKKILSLALLILSVLSLRAQGVELYNQEQSRGSWGFEIGTHNVVNYSLPLGTRGLFRGSLGAAMLSDGFIPRGFAPYLNAEYRHFVGAKQDAMQRNGLYAGLRAEGYSFKPALWLGDYNAGSQIAELRTGPFVGLIFRTGQNVRMYAEVGVMQGFNVSNPDNRVKFERRGKLHIPYGFGVLYSL